MIAAATVALVGCHTGNIHLDPHTDSLSWALGEQVGLTLRNNELGDINNDLFLQAVRHTLEGKQQPLSDETITHLLQSLAQPAPTPTANHHATASDPSQIDQQQQAYFAQLEKTNPNVKRHPAGFYYEQLTPGSGPNARIASRIRFDFRSYLMLTGQPFDQTYGNRQPIVHVVGNPMFPGLIEGLQLMNAGSKYRFYFPYQLTFGEQGSGSVPGYTPMIYEIELHEIYPD